MIQLCWLVTGLSLHRRVTWSVSCICGFVPTTHFRLHNLCLLLCHDCHPYLKPSHTSTASYYIHCGLFDNKGTTLSCWLALPCGWTLSENIISNYVWNYYIHKLKSISLAG